MTKSFAYLAGAAVGLCLLAQAPAQAGIAWQYDFTPVGGSTTLLSDNKQSSLTLTNQPNYTAVGNSDVVATNIGANSKTSDSTPDTFTSVPYKIVMLLKDSLSGASTTLTFGGMISGTVSQHSTNTTNVFSLPTSYTNIHLGSNIYTVTIGPYTGPGPGGGLTGSIGAHVTVTGNGGGGPNNTPEPTSMVLAGLGLSFAGLGAWRRRRRMA